MFLNKSRRFFLLQLLFLSASACQSKPRQNSGYLIIGTIGYGGEQRAINRYDRFNRYLAEKIGAHIELEPAFNEKKALERIQERAWSLVFAPPGLAAIAIARCQYAPLFPLPDASNTRSIVVVRKDSPILSLKELEGQTLALGQPGSATGYYLPLYNLYGLTLSEVLLTTTPKALLELVFRGNAVAGALSIEQFNLYSPQVSRTGFRILYIDTHNVPSGAVLLGPRVERNRQEHIRKVMREAPEVLTQEVGYVPTRLVPDYRYMISVVEKVSSIFPDGIKPGAVQIFPKSADSRVSRVQG